MIAPTRTLLAIAALALAGCHREVPQGSVVLTQTPVGAPAAVAATVLDGLYPLGSRVVLLPAPFRTDGVRVLSTGLVAAGDPCVSWDGQWIYFSGKEAADGTWQIYKVNAGGGRPERVTNMAGGAMGPAIAAHSELVFSSPVPRTGEVGGSGPRTAIYGQLPGQAPRQFTFGRDDAVGATVLRDGRILFVTAKPTDDRAAPRHLCLFAMNNDGTEVSAYACQDGGADRVRRPRELGDGRIAFLASGTDETSANQRAECVRSAAPFVTRGALFPFSTVGCRSVEWTPENDLLACMETRGMVGRSMSSRAAVYRLAPNASALGAPVFDDPYWNCIEATSIAARPEPSGHTTAIMPTASTGTILCLDVNESSEPAVGGTAGRAAKLRVFATDAAGQTRELGTVPVASDGSVLVRLPAKVPLGFDTLDAQGRVLRHQSPFVWLHPGENRGCVGCHEPRNHAPRNFRPLATQIEPARLDFTAPPTATTSIAP